MKEERSRSDASREKELTALIKQNELLNFANEELKKEFKTKTEEYDVKCSVSILHFLSPTFSPMDRGRASDLIANICT